MDKTESIDVDVTTLKRDSRKQYSSPTLTVYGRVETLTQATSSGGAADGAFTCVDEDGGNSAICLGGAS